ncbi:Low density lipoprotein B-like protein [Phaffia rhodozyma]|uniref:Conserved oligomeric Golgi complex subunit 1 n=1 Tax=Phaffia rhodozyma TaxID=264483 RepID=A0A0F7SR60_PHARH|nr:Low density lipoprotein B-like protein [Phaffia rhodozyma]
MAASTTSAPPLPTNAPPQHSPFGLSLGSPTSEVPRPTFGRGQAHENPLVAKRGILLRASSSRSNNLTANHPEGELDQSRLDTEELFRALAIGEVRRVEARLRSSALSKQTELRTMVGERYRDLLSSSAALSTLFASSSRLSDSLKVMKAVTSSAGEGGVASISGSIGNLRGGSVKSDAGDDAIAEDLDTLLPLASQTKLLLDAPEILWRLLERKQFLHAAWLFSLGRIVHQEVGEISDTSIQLPLLHRQWESLSTFRSQIVHRATLGLKELSLSPLDMSQTLIAILLLDNISLPQALNLLLSQRTKLLQTALISSNQPARSQQSVNNALLSSDDISAVPPSNKEGFHRENMTQDQVQALLEEIVSVLGGTIGLAREIFASEESDQTSGSSKAEKKSLIESVIGGIERGDVTDTSSQALPSDQTLRSPPIDSVDENGDGMGKLISMSKERIYKRRASRLAMSFSFPAGVSPNLSSPASRSSPFGLSNAQGGSLSTSSQLVPNLTTDSLSRERFLSEPVITSSGLLRQLPSSPLLLRYLPPSIRNYTPFILSSEASTSSSMSNLSPPQLTKSLAAWFQQNTSLLHSTLHSILASLSTTADVWAVRAHVGQLLAKVPGLKPDERKILEDVLEEGWAGRVKDVWDSAFKDLGDRVERSVRSKVSTLSEAPSTSGGPLLAGGKEIEGDLNPSSFLFSASIPFPSNAESIPPSTSLPIFRAALRRRVAGRTALLDGVLREAEAAAGAIKIDLEGLRKLAEGGEGIESTLLGKYKVLATEALEGLAVRLGAVLDDQSLLADSINTEIFVGRVALHLVSSGSFYSDIMGPGVSPDIWRARLKEIHTRSLVKFESASIHRALDHVRRIFELDEVVANTTSLYLWKLVLPGLPSRELHLALNSLVSSIQTLGTPPSFDLKLYGSSLLENFLRRFRESDSWETVKGKTAVQVLWDVLFLRTLSSIQLRSEPGTDGTVWDDLIDRLTIKARDVLAIDQQSVDLSELMRPSIESELIRCQTVLCPILKLGSASQLKMDSNGSAEKAQGEADSKHQALLALGVSGLTTTTTTAAAELQSSLALIAPSQRFSLLSITATFR